MAILEKRFAELDGNKELGAYYTSDSVARFLVNWAIRTSNDTVLDPSFGGGVFLRAASERISLLGGDPIKQLYGIELDPATHCKIGDSLSAHSVSYANLTLNNFFDVEPLPVNQVTAIVGNPPF